MSKEEVYEESKTQIEEEEYLLKPSQHLIEPEDLHHPLLSASDRDDEDSETISKSDDHELNEIEAISSLSQGALMRIDDDDDVGKHLLLGSLHLDGGKVDGVANWHIRDDDGLLRGMKS